MKCGDLPCPPYVQDRELSCVVCSPPENRTGALYTRWGRTTCPNDTDLVYAGRAVGAHHGESGSGANAMCLYDEQSYNDHNDNQQYGARIYGITYYTSGYGLPPDPFNNVHQRRAPCAVCLIPQKEVAIMTPGRTDCPPSWTVEYSGYLMANQHGNYKMNYVCVDKDPEVVSSSSSSNQGRWYPTETECGAIQCRTGVTGGYSQNREVTCSVCSPETKRKSSVFTRWGRTTCPFDTTIVYSGFMAGEHHGHRGGSASYLCMRNESLYADYNSQNQDGSLLYGYEYKTSGYGLTSPEYQSVANRRVGTAAK